MADIEKSFFVPNRDDFQPIIGYREVVKSPQVVVRQTNTLLGLYYQGAIRDPDQAKSYLCEYTLGYLNAAEEGSDLLYERFGQFTGQDIDLETKEAADYTLVVLACLPDRAKSPFLPNGFSRSGMLKPPTTRVQFLTSIRELKIGIRQVVIGDIEPYATLEAYPAVLRVFNFFEVGSRLPMRLMDDEKKYERIEREKFNDLLGGIDISIQ